jgi:hypothetical protein
LGTEGFSQVLLGSVHTDGHSICGAAEDGGSFCVREAFPHHKAQSVPLARPELIDGPQYGVGGGRLLVLYRRRRGLFL